MNEKETKEILQKAKEFFANKIAINHIKNTETLTLSKFNVNPFLIKYLATFLTGDDSPISIAKALVYPRVLGTSINTSFGTNLQYFCSNVLSGFASGITGLDIEFVDQIDGRKKYCQIKAGPNTINSDDVETIFNHFKSVIGIARTNHLDIGVSDLIIGVLYGLPGELSMHYKKIDERYPVYVGKDFWHRLTGKESFYSDLIDSIGEVAKEADGTELLDIIIKKLAKEIEESVDF